MRISLSKRQTEPAEWFAWHPVLADAPDGIGWVLVWLETVVRYEQNFGDWFWVYKVQS